MSLPELSSGLLLTLVPCVLISALVAYPAWTLVRVYRGVPTRVPEDASHLNTPPPASAASITSQLAALGFRRLGEVQIRIPGQPQPGMEWVFASQDAATYAEVVGLEGGAVLLTSTFRDGAVVETGYPLGEHINDPDFVSHTVTTSVEDAYRHQLALIEAARPNHGEPERVDSIADMLRHDLSYRQRYAQRKMMAGFKRQYLGCGLVVLYMLGVGGLLGLLNLFPALPSVVRVGIPAFLFFGAIIGLQVWGMWQRGRAAETLAWIGAVVVLLLALAWLARATSLLPEVRAVVGLVLGGTLIGGLVWWRARQRRKVPPG